MSMCLDPTYSYSVPAMVRWPLTFVHIVCIRVYVVENTAEYLTNCSLPNLAPDLQVKEALLHGTRPPCVFKCPAGVTTGHSCSAPKMASGLVTAQNQNSVQRELASEAERRGCVRPMTGTFTSS